jgi:hypothetical protein
VSAAPWDAGVAKEHAHQGQPKTNRNGYEIVDELAPSEGPRHLQVKPSGFFGTPMAAYLT